jgi:hypothetical protein
VEAIYAGPDVADGVGSGAESNPWPLKRALLELKKPEYRVLCLLGGEYVGFFTAEGIDGSAGNRKEIRSAPGQLAVIVGAEPEFMYPTAQTWTAPTAGSDVYTSTSLLPSTYEPRGAFASRSPYTRLVTHQTLEDLVSGNERSGHLCDTTSIEGPPAPNGVARRPFIYLGPGLFHDRLLAHESALRIRLSPTHNQVAFYADYDGPSDPRTLPLAIWRDDSRALSVRNCSYLCVRDLGVRFGAVSVLVADSNDVELDHLAVLAGNAGVQFVGACTRITLANCSVDGGLPPWFFRSDRKDTFTTIESDGQARDRAPGQGTFGTLVGRQDPESPQSIITDLHIRWCEFANGHDISILGKGTRFWRNWVRNIDDDALIIDTVGSSDVRIYENVVEQCETLISSGTTAPETAMSSTYFYRNLCDLRRPIAKTRPRLEAGLDCDPAAADRRTLDHGHFYKSSPPNGALYIFQNTLVLRDVEGAATFNHFRSMSVGAPLQAFSNIFVAVDTTPKSKKPMTFEPFPQEGVESARNYYFRVGQYLSAEFLLRVDGPDSFTGFPTLAAFQATTDQFEEGSREGDPGFRRFAPFHSGPSGLDDFRLRVDSPARNAGRDCSDLGDVPPSVPPDIGCFHYWDPPLAVGVEGRRQFPIPSPTVPPGATHGDPPQDVVLP